MPKDITLSPMARSLISHKTPINGKVLLAPDTESGAINLRLRTNTARRTVEDALGLTIDETHSDS